MRKNTKAWPAALVPVSEIAPGFVTSAELFDWLEARGWQTWLDHRGQICVDGPTAYEYAEAQREESARHAERQARERIKLERQVREAQAARQGTYTEAYVAAAQRRLSPRDCNEAGWEAVHVAEKRLSEAVKRELVGVPIPNVIGVPEPAEG